MDKYGMKSNCFCKKLLLTGQGTPFSQLLHSWAYIYLRLLAITSVLAVVACAQLCCYICMYIQIIELSKYDRQLWGGWEAAAKPMEPGQSHDMAIL